ncbi:hypothetical protein L202_07748 [Cryptococcus amylolentus CBS 6039]|uniref:FAD dependent oxidoreductase domain-containing protein n=2 Tax=Cryptococcus amylolentus TaxID=104669 RepID=A0A1E3HA13_9TREE|nr:hypothetical protein L202_07748 [Cryptococcus amylolentus CBS 6039]ODN73187.1 hypothetical protein L202_07748 [Cryptococcus amylolentus CBS 6039]ODN99010.1 hypothetical protein I350_07162 [Cryptococcus amylolentus CBS 6273]
MTPTWFCQSQTPPGHSGLKPPKKADIVIIASGYSGTSSACWIHKFAKPGHVPSIAILQARDAATYDRASTPPTLPGLLIRSRRRAQFTEDFERARESASTPCAVKI